MWLVLPVFLVVLVIALTAILALGIVGGLALAGGSRLAGGWVGVQALHVLLGSIGFLSALALLALAMVLARRLEDVRDALEHPDREAWIEQLAEQVAFDAASPARRKPRKRKPPEGSRRRASPH